MVGSPSHSDDLSHCDLVIIVILMGESFGYWDGHRDGHCDNFVCCEGKVYHQTQCRRDVTVNCCVDTYLEFLNI